MDNNLTFSIEQLVGIIKKMEYFIIGITFKKD